jgi:hypothetical protein
MTQHDWGADVLLISIPFRLLLIGVVAVPAFINDYLVPAPVRAWFADRLCGPGVMLHYGFVPIYKPFHKWDAQS